MKRAILFVAFAALCGAQTTVNGGRDYKGTLKASGSVSAVDFSGAGGTAPVKAGTSASRPTACTQGQIYFATDVAAGQNLYFCTVTGAPGVWSQMSGNGAAAVTAGPGGPSGNCTPPVVYIDTTNQDLWFCSAANSWKRAGADTSGLPTLAGTNTWTGYSNLSGGQWRPPEATVANLPSSAGNAGKVFMVTDAASAGNCSTGGGSLRELCRANGSTYECVGGCGSAGGGGGATAYISSLLSGPDSTRTITGATHGFATTALLVAVYDNASPRNAISVGWTVNSSTYDVTLAFASPQSNYYVVINGGVGPAGAAGPAGPAPSGTGIVKVTSGTAGLAVAGADYAVATNGTNGQALTSNGAGGFGTAATLASVATSGSASDLGAGTLPAARLPNPAASTKGGVQSKDCTGAGHILSINTDGTSTCSADSGGVGSSSSGQVLVNTSGAVAGVARAGNGNIASASGTLTNGHCVSIDSNGNFVDAGGSCSTGGGGGTVNSAASGNLAYYASTGTAVSGGAFTGDVTNTGLATQVTAKLRTHSGCFDFGADNASADLADADIGPQGRIFMIPVAATIIEATVAANAGTPKMPIIQKNHAGTATDVTSAALATAASGAVACAATGSVCLDSTSKDGTVSIVTAGSANVLAAGDWIQTKTGSGFASSGAKRISICLTWTAN